MFYSKYKKKIVARSERTRSHCWKSNLQRNNNLGYISHWKGVSLMGLRGVVRYVQRTCGNSSTNFPFVSSSLFLSPLTMTLLTASAYPFSCGYAWNIYLLCLGHSNTSWKLCYHTKVRCPRWGYEGFQTECQYFFKWIFWHPCPWYLPMVQLQPTWRSNSYRPINISYSLLP